MILFALPSLVSAALMFTLGLWVFFRNRAGMVNRAFLLLCLAMSWWAFSEFMLMQSTSPDTAAIWLKLTAFWTLVPPLLLRFILVFTGRWEPEKDWWMLPFIYAPGVLFCILELFTGLITTGPVQEAWGYTYGYAASLSLFYVEVFWALGLVLLALAICIRYSVRAQRKQERLQAISMAAGIGIIVCGGFLFQVILFAYQIVVPVTATFFFLCFSVLVSYAIWKHELFVISPETTAEAIVTTIPDALLLLDDRETIRVANAAAERLLGRTDLPGTPVSALFPTTEETRRVCDQVRETGHVSDMETAFIGRDATLVAVSISASVIRDSGGAVAGIVCVARDIRQRKEIEAELEGNREYLGTLFASVQAGILVIDTVTHRILDANPAALAMIGAEKEKVVGRTCHRFVCPAEDGKCPVTNLGLVVDDTERVLVTFNGEKIPIIKYAVPVMLNGKKCLLETFIDNSARKKMEQALKESEERYRAVFENTGTAMLILEEDTTISLANSEFERLSGYTREELEGKIPWTVFTVPEFRQMMLDQHRLRRVDQEKALKRYMAPFLTRSGEIRTTLLDVGMIPGTTKSVVGLADITNWRRAEEALKRATKKLNVLNTITFSEVQNAVFTLSGYLELEAADIRDENLKRMVERQRAIVRKIAQSLKFAALFQNLGLHPPQWQDLGTAFLYGISHLDLAGITKETALSGVEIYADPLLENVFFVLVENTLVHGKTATEIRAGYHETADGLVITCSDNGVGIPESEKESIFSKDTSSMQNPGLFLSREILGITGITITETGTPGTGARFEVLVPRGGFRFTGGETSGDHKA